uniref:aECM cysteine-cradle domain-containing protein n=2 Tax=Caenorhabditis japonica TaxID=281687 RepID=A0A8R1DMF2_CAEJA
MAFNPRLEETKRNETRVMRHFLALLPALFTVAVAQDHFIDVRALVKDTIDAIKEVPSMMNQNQNQTTSTSSASASASSSQPELSTVQPKKAGKGRSDVYDSLLKLPADIMSQLARDAGFVDEKSQKASVEEEKKEVERVEKKKEEEESYSFKTVDDLKAEERRQAIERTTVAPKQLEDNDDIFSISKLISATGNAIREAQAAQAAQQPQQEPMITLPPLVPLPPTPLQMPALQVPSAASAASVSSQPATEIMYRPVTRDGKTVFEQVVVLKNANGSVKLVPNSVLPQLPVEAPKPLEIKQVNKEAVEFLAPTFPPVVNLFDQLTSPTAESTTTTTTMTTSEEPESTTEQVKPRRKSLPRRKIQYLEKKANDMHSRQFGAKTVQMSDPIEIQAQEEQEPINVLQKEGNLRVHAINHRRKSRKPRVVKVQKTEKVEEQPTEDQEETTEPPKKKRKMMRKVQKKVGKKEIRKLPDLYDEQWKTQVAPSVSPPSEDFAEQFDGVDEVQEAPKKNNLVQEQPQNDTPMNDAMEQRSSKVNMMTKEQEEEMLNKEVRKRVLQRIRLSKLKVEKSTTTTTTTTTEEPTTTTTEKKSEDDEDDVIEVEELEEDEEEEEEVTTTTTTTEAPVTRAERVKKTNKRAVVTKHQCLNLRSFARQFLFDTVEEFVKEHCYFIENYYPALTCARSHAYVAKCQKWLKEE